ncbi:MAG: hypothetical protein AAGG09_19085 [Pseudomonadota bacterium]
MQATFSQRLRRALGQLFLALLNATLILLIVALALLWRVSATVESATASVTALAAEQAGRIAPVRDEMRGIRDEISALRMDLAALRGEGVAGQEAVDRALVQLDEAQARWAAVSDRVAPLAEALSEDPGIVVDRAVASGVAEAGQWLAALRGCSAMPPS